MRSCGFFIIFVLAVCYSIGSNTVFAQKDYELFQRPFLKINDDLKRVGLDELKSISKVEFESGNYRLDSDFCLGYGDTLNVNLWGKIEASYKLTVDRDGGIIIPLIGKISVIGLTLDKARLVIQRELDKRYSNVEFDLNLAAVEDIRISVLGEVKSPGVYSTSPFARIVETFAKCGGPSAEGSIADIRLIRNGKQIANFNTYDYLFKADQSKNLRLKNNDTIFVPKMHQVIAVRGDVTRPGIYEKTKDTTIAKALDMTGGIVSKQGMTKVYVLRVNTEKKINEKITEFTFESIEKIKPEDDINLEDEDTIIVTTELEYAPFALNIFNEVTISGEVKMPGIYLIHDKESLSFLLKRAGGLKDTAFAKGVIFTRVSVRDKHKSLIEGIISLQEQRILEEEAQLEDLVLTGEERILRERSFDKRKKALELMKSRIYEGRIIVDLQGILKGKPDIVLKKGDSIYIPSIPDSVLVTGAVYNPSAVAFIEGKQFGYYLNTVGGKMIPEDKSDVYIIKSDGSAESKNTGYSNIGRGDIIVVLEK